MRKRGDKKQYYNDETDLAETQQQNINPGKAISKIHTMKTFLRNSSILLGSTMTVMAGATISPALPAIAEHFSEVPNSDLLVKLVLTVPALAIAFIAPFTGLILDRLGRRPVLLFCLALYGIAGTAGFYLNTLEGIIISRAVLGIGVSGIMTGFTALIADYFDGEELNRFMGIQAGFMGFGGVVFISAGGILADVSWRFPFLIYFFSLAILPLVYRFVPEPVRNSSHSASSLREMFRLPGGFKRRPVLLIYSIAITCMLAFYLVPVQLPFLMKEIANSSNSRIGTVMAGMILCSSIISMRYKWFRARLSHEAILILNFSMMAAGFLVISLAARVAVLAAGLIIIGLGMGTYWPNISVWLVKYAPVNMRGRIFGGLTTSVYLGQFLSPVIARPLSDAAGIAGCFQFTGIFLILIISGFALTAYLLRRKRRD